MPSYDPVPAGSDGIGANSKTSSPSMFSRFLSHMKASFRSLDGSPPELYVNFFLHFCDSYSYFALSQILVLYLHSSFGVSDLEAGAAYGIWGAAITFWGFVTGCFNDRLGIRRSLLIGFTIALLSNLTIALTTSKTVVLFVLFSTLPLGNCMGIPMLTVAVKRATTRRNRGFAFGLYYSVMNIAALLSGPVVDFFNIAVPPTDENAYMTGNRMIVLSVAASNLVSLLTTYFFLRDIPQLEDINSDDEDDSDHISQHVQPSSPNKHKPVSAHDTEDLAVLPIHREESSDEVLEAESEHISRRLHQRQHRLEHRTLLPATPAAPVPASEEVVYNTLQPEESHEHAHTGSNSNHHVAPSSMQNIVSDLLYSLTFWRFCVFTLFLINLKMIFRHLDATLPTYLLRCFGSRYPKGMIYAINPFMIVWLTPVVAALTSHWPHYDMIKYGGYLSALSPFFLAVSTSTPAVVCFMVCLSLGEAIWSPRVYDYTMTIAPQGKEATFSALAAAPLFAAKIPVGLLSGYLLAHYLPDDESDGVSAQDRRENGQMLWLIVGLLTISSPLLITFCESCIREPERRVTTRSRNDSQDRGSADGDIEAVVLSPIAALVESAAADNDDNNSGLHRAPDE